MVTVKELACDIVVFVICSNAAPVKVTEFNAKSPKLNVLIVPAVFVLLTVRLVAAS